MNISLFMISTTVKDGSFDSDQIEEVHQLIITVIIFNYLVERCTYLKNR
ncbi:conserved hypothetical protein [Bacillus altitudinis]|nr:conserved hypothetical protein [Bacillus altitudinis]